jgi:hypothetical protein
MEPKRYWDQLRSELRRRSLPPTYVARLLGELQDHWHDFQEEHVMATGTDAARLVAIEDQLGACRDVAGMAAEQYRSRTFLGRHPWLTFVVGPVPLWLLATVGYLLILIAVGSMVEGKTIHTHPALVQGFVWVCYGLAYLPAAGAAALLCWAARRTGRSWRWYVPACGMIAAVVSLLFVRCTAPATPGGGQLMLGWNFSFPPAVQVGQALVPLSIAACAVLLRQRSS